AAIDEHFENLRLSDALMAVYKLFWDDFCSWYLEMVKPPFGQPMDSATYAATTDFFDRLLRLLHPFMPFITEELWMHLTEAESEQTVLDRPWPKSAAAEAKVLHRFAMLSDVIGAIRAIRGEMQVNPGAQVSVVL